MKTETKTEESPKDEFEIEEVKRSSRRKIQKRVFTIWFIVLWCVFLRFQFSFAPLEVSKSTTWIEGPLHSDGIGVDYFAVLSGIFIPMK